MSQSYTGSPGLDAYLEAAREVDQMSLYKSLHGLNCKLRGSEEPDYDGTSAITLLAGRMLRAGIPRPQVDQVLLHLANTQDREVLLTGVVGVVDGLYLYFSLTESTYFRIPDFVQVPEETCQNPEESILWVLASFQKNLELALASTQKG